MLYLTTILAVIVALQAIAMLGLHISYQETKGQLYSRATSAESDRDYHMNRFYNLRVEMFEKEQKNKLIEPEPVQPPLTEEIDGDMNRFKDL